MASDLIRRAADAIAELQGPISRPSNRLLRATGEAIQLEQARGFVQETKVDAVARVGARCMQHAADLSDDEAILTARSPHGAHRYAAIADMAAARLAQILSQTGRN